MGTPQLNLIENSIKQNKIKGYPQKANGVSFWAFLLSIFIYISVFYVFNLSPSTLFTNPKFWFFISNTLVLIIAADFGAFSSSRKLDLYDEFAKNSRGRANVSSFELPYPNNVSIPKQEVDIGQEKIKEVVAVHGTQFSENNSSVHETPTFRDLGRVRYTQFPEKKWEIVVKDDSDKPSRENYEKNTTELASKVGDCDETQEKVEIESEKAMVDSEDKKMIVLHRPETGKVEENEFSKMSDEELNRRVEEFIQRFNRQIRLQAAARKFEEV